MYIEGKWHAIDVQSAELFLVLPANPHVFPQARPLSAKLFFLMARLAPTAANSGTPVNVFLAHPS
jgi:hypothetical protein